MDELQLVLNIPRQIEVFVFKNSEFVTFIFSLPDIRFLRWSIQIWADNS